MKCITGVIVLSLLFLCLVQMGYGYTLEEKFSRQFNFRSEGLISVHNTNGNISIEGWEKNEVLIEAIKRVKAPDKRDAERYMERIEIEINQANDEIFIRTRLPRKRGGGFFNMIFGGDVSGSVKYRIFVPKESDIESKTTNGGINIAEVSGKIELGTTNGKIQGSELSGRVNAHTTNGSINVELSHVYKNNEMGFFTTNGSIRVYLPDDIECNVRARTTNGSLYSDFPLKMRGRFHDKRIEGAINGGGALLEFKTTNGSIRINRL